MLDARFWTKVDKSDPEGCWIWTANKNNKGYGLFRPGGTAPKRLAHRLSYEAENGPVPDGAFVLHSCDNPSCVNPAHLRAGSAKDNVADMIERERRVWRGLKGAEQYAAKFTDSDVIAIRNDYVGGIPIGILAKRYSVSIHAIHDVTGGRSWRHVFDDPRCPSQDCLATEARRRQKSNVALTLDDVREIRRRLSAGDRGVDIAADYGVGKDCISSIKLGKTWRDA